MKFQIHAMAAGKVRKAHSLVAFGAITTIRVDPRVWREAMKIAHGDYRRIDIINDTTVIVRNWRVR